MSVLDSIDAAFAVLVDDILVNVVSVKAGVDIGDEVLANEVDVGVLKLDCCRSRQSAAENNKDFVSSMLYFAR